MKKKGKNLKPLGDRIIDAGRNLKLRELWESDRDALLGDSPDDATAAGYWIGYPTFVSLLCSKNDPEHTFFSAMQSLDSVHRAAIQHLMRLAVQVGVNEAPFWPAMLLCERLVANGEPMAGPFHTWPERFRDAKLSEADRQVMDAGDVAFMQLVARLGIEIPSKPALSENDLKILEYLQECSPIAKSQEDIAAGADLSRRTVQARLKELQSMGFAKQLGERKGYAITENGEKVIG